MFEIRNKFMIELADSIVIAHSTAGGGLKKLLNEQEIKKAYYFFELIDRSILIFRLLIIEL